MKYFLAAFIFIIIGPPAFAQARYIGLSGLSVGLTPTEAFAQFQAFGLSPQSKVINGSNLVTTSLTDPNTNNQIYVIAGFGVRTNSLSSVALSFSDEVTDSGTLNPKGQRQYNAWLNQLTRQYGRPSETGRDTKDQFIYCHGPNFEVSLETSIVGKEFDIVLTYFYRDKVCEGVRPFPAAQGPIAYLVENNQAPAPPTSVAMPNGQIPSQKEAIRLIESYHNRVVKRSGGSIISGSVKIEKITANEVWGTINLTRTNSDRTLIEGFLARFSSGEISCYLLRDLNTGKPYQACAPASPTDAEAEVEFQSYLARYPTKAMQIQASAQRLSGAFLNSEDVACLKEENEPYNEMENSSECSSGTYYQNGNSKGYECNIYAKRYVERSRLVEINVCSRPITFRYGCGSGGGVTNKHRIDTVKPGDKYYPTLGPPFCFKEYP